MGWYFRRPSLENLMNFKPFMAAVAAQFAAMSKHELYRLNVPGQDVWDCYLASFPAGANPIFKTKTQHDGSYDRHFVRDVGNVVAVTANGDYMSIWGASGLNTPYAEVCTRVSELLVSCQIANLFRTKETSIGHMPNVAQRSDGTTERFNHFLVDVAARHRIPSSTTVDTVLGEARTRAELFQRGLEEIKLQALETVLDLIEQKTLYRGDEFETSVRMFQKLQRDYIGATLVGKNTNAFIWQNLDSPAARLRNTAIGTLLTDLSEGVEFERALKAFEQKVAPTNYKRPTAAITPKMITSALGTLQELGLESALERRFATISDINVNNVIWVDNSSRAAMKGGLSDLLMKEVKVSANKIAPNAAVISADDFMRKILPKAESLEVFFANQFQSNLMSLTAPVHADAPPLFKWDNNFAWSYNGNIADSEMRRAVQAKGGRVDGVFRFSHSWNYAKRNTSLMDLHVFLPGSSIRDDDPINDFYGNEYHVGWNHRRHTPSGGVQDVDFTAEAPVGYVPVENITFPDMAKLKDGKYICKIHNWRFRTPTEGGFKAEIEFGGQVFQYECTRPLKHKEWMTVAVVTLANGAFTIEHKMPSQASSQNRWGVNTEQFVKVRTVMNSPNHWDGRMTGNKHVFFILDGCLNDEPTRGIYNEFLRPELEPHRKVFEILGNKTKCEVQPEQLSGLGFSSTKRESVLFKVSTSSSTKMYSVVF